MCGFQPDAPASPPARPSSARCSSPTSCCADCAPGCGPDRSWRRVTRPAFHITGRTPQCLAPPPTRKLARRCTPRPAPTGPRRKTFSTGSTPCSGSSSTRAPRRRTRKPPACSQKTTRTRLDATGWPGNGRETRTPYTARSGAIRPTARRLASGPAKPRQRRAKAHPPARLRAVARLPARAVREQDTRVRPTARL